MFNLRKVFLVLLNLFIIGAFICTFFMQNVVRTYYYSGNVTSDLEPNGYGIPLLTLIPLGLTASLASLLFSFFNKKGLYLPSCIVNIHVAPLVIIGIIFSAISLDMGANEAASIVSTVFCGISFALTIVTTILGFVYLRRLSKNDQVVSTYQREKYAQSLSQPVHEEPATNQNVSRSDNTSGNNLSIDKMYDELKKIKELLDNGVITQAEFDELKKRIMN